MFGLPVMALHEYSLSNFRCTNTWNIAALHSFGRPFLMAVAFELLSLETMMVLFKGYVSIKTSRFECNFPLTVFHGVWNFMTPK